MTTSDQKLLQVFNSNDEWVPNYLQQPLERINLVNSPLSVLQSYSSGDWMKPITSLNSDCCINGNPYDISNSFCDMMSCSKSHFKPPKRRVTSNGWMLSCKADPEPLQQSIPTEYIFNDDCIVNDDWETLLLNSFLSCSNDNDLTRFCDVKNDIKNLSLEADVACSSILGLTSVSENAQKMQMQPSLGCEQLSEDNVDLSDNKLTPSDYEVASANIEAEGYCTPNERDVLFGRGGLTNHHHGNKRYREEVERLKPWYESCKTKSEKNNVSQLLVKYIRSYGGRFLEKDKGSGQWIEVGFNSARKKVSQALRERNQKRQQCN